MRKLIVLALCLVLLNITFVAAQSTNQERQNQQTQEQQQPLEERERVQQPDQNRQQFGRETSETEIQGEMEGRESLPQTASPLALIGLMGLLSMGGAAAVRALRK